MVVALRCRWCVMLMLAVCGACVAAEPPAKTALRELKPKVEGLRAQARPAAAIEACEAFLKQFPDVLPYSRNVAVIINNVVSADLKSPAEQLAVYRRAYEQFQNSPDYYSLGVVNVARDLLTAQAKPAEAEALLAGAITQLGDRLARDSYVGFNLYVLRLQALRAQQQAAEGLAAAREYAQQSPWMLSDRGFLRVVYDLARDDPEGAQQLAAARTYYGLCDFTETAVQDATEAVALALKVEQGPGAALQFAKAQEDAAVGSPLKAVPLLDLGDADTMMAAAGDDVEAQLNVALYRGDVAQAIEHGRTLLRRSSTQNPYYVAKALRHLARCFKAYDLALPRANAFLEYHSTGTGQNPLEQLQQDVAATASETVVAKGE